MAWITPKTNWTANDYYNYADLNRVENNCYEIENLINTYAYLSPRTYVMSRTNSTIEYFDTFNRIEGNMAAFAAATATPLGWITPKTNWQSVVDKFSYTDANRLESNLDALKTMIGNTINSLLNCGAANAICGQDASYL